MAPPNHPVTSAPALRWPTWLALAAVVLILVFTLLDPAPSRGLSAPMRVLFWSCHIVPLLALCQLWQAALARYRRGGRVAAIAQTAASGALGAVTFAPVAVALDRVFPVVGEIEDDGALWLEIGTEALALAPLVMLVWLGLNGRHILAVPDRAALPEPAVETGLWATLPKALGRDLISLSAELHYTRVTTTQGEALVLYPISGAISDVASEVPGVQLHRSHWAALRHIETLERQGARAVCVLSNGQRLPVSRARRREVAAAL
ncbi:MAG: LytTR family DNA-binding domain-containing protein [Pseudomonadota bacterium]